MNYQVELMDSAVAFVQTLEIKMRAKVFRTVGLLEQFGSQLPLPHAKTLKECNGLKELRVKLGSTIVRLFYFHHEGRVYVLTSGYVKKDQKTDPREIKRAIRLKSEFLKGTHHD